MRSLMLLAILAACKPDPASPAADADDSASPAACETTFSYTVAPGAEAPTSVSVVGAFNQWEPGHTELVEVSPGRWEGSVALPPGAHPYRLAEFFAWSQDGFAQEVCDPNATLIHCDDGYKEPWQTDWRHDCSQPAETACDSMVVVADCGSPTVALDRLTIDRAAGTLTLALAATPAAGAGAIDRFTATLDGEPVEVSTDGASGTLTLSGLSPSRHTVRITVTDDAGGTSDELYVPVWMDAAGDDAWRQGSIYFAFVDRLRDGDATNNGSEGTSTDIGGYMGGDLQGVLDLMPYLDELGVQTVWLSNPQDNAEGAWAGQCAQTYAGYHAYWPDDARTVEEHFGDADLLHQVVAAAHDRDMRVIMDWVANHVHQDHPYYRDHADTWFNPQAVCQDSSGGQQNWDRIPEACWFAEYLPDIDYAQPEALDLMVEDALWWVKTYELDGLRVDAVKHMPHSVAWNLEARIRAEIEHTAAGGDEQFWTVGETFDGYDRINAYITRGDDLLGLDGQFDFPLYYTMQAVFGSMSADLSALEAGVATADAVYGDALMSSFLGNHDVMRFVSEATEGYQDACTGGDTLRNAGLAWDPHIYTRMRLAWTFLFTQAAVPLVYYGDEIGIPGYTDPDNRQPLWWYADTDAASVDAIASQLDGDRAALLRHVAALGQARQVHPALYRGATTEWWRAPAEAPSLWAYARVDADSGDEAIVILNRTDADQTLTNGLAYAGLTPASTFEDALTGETFAASGDSLSVGVPAWGSRVLVRR